MTMPITIDELRAKWTEWYGPDHRFTEAQLQEAVDRSNRHEAFKRQRLQTFEWRPPHIVLDGYLCLVVGTEHVTEERAREIAEHVTDACNGVPSEVQADETGWWVPLKGIGADTTLEAKWETS